MRSFPHFCQNGHQPVAHSSPDNPGIPEELECPVCRERALRNDVESELALLRPLVEALDPIANYKPDPGDVVCIDWESMYAKVFEAHAKYRESFPR